MDHWLRGGLILLFGILLIVEAKRIPKAISLRFGGYVETGNGSSTGATVARIIGTTIVMYGIYYIVTS